MKSYRRIAALFLCLLLVCTAASASAATKKPSKTFTAAPTLKFTDSPKYCASGSESNMLTISASAPGFLSLYLLDRDGNLYLTIAENMEIHSNANTIDFAAVDNAGNPLTPGKYMFSAQMVNQFGLSSAVITKNTTLNENPDLDLKETTAVVPATAVATTIATAAPAVSTTTVTTSNTAASTTTASTTAASNTAANTTTAAVTAAPKATPVPDVLQYAAGTSKMGDEGLLIGVGVSDVAAQTDAGYWGLTASATDAEIWAAITRKMVGVNVDESESAYIYDSAESGRKKIGTVSGISQGLNVITERGDGWALVEAFRNEDGAFVRGYIKADKLRPVDPNPNYGIVIDKAAQTLTVFKDGARVGSCKVTTGLATPKYPHRETPAGEFITVTRRGSVEYYGTGYFTKYTIRLNGNYYLAETPTTKKNGTKFVEEIVSSLGTKGTRGTICIANEASTDGGINAKWIWDMTDANKRVKVLIFDDKARTDVPAYSK